MESLINFLRNLSHARSPLAVDGFRIKAKLTPEQLEKTHEFLKGKHIKTIERSIKGRADSL